MKTELLYLLLTSILTGTLWIPVVIGYLSSRGIPTPSDYESAPTSSLPDWVNRANRAHLNAVESFAPFAAVVLIANATGVSNGVTESCAAVYFYARRSCRHSRQWLWALHGQNRGVHGGLGRVRRLRRSSAATRDLNAGLRALAVRFAKVTGRGWH